MYPNYIEQRKDVERNKGIEIIIWIFGDRETGDGRYDEQMNMLSAKDRMRSFCLQVGHV